MRLTKRTNLSVTILLLLFGLICILVLPGLPVGRAATTPRGPSQKVSTSGLDGARQAAMEKLYGQLKSGDSFSEEEGIILRRFAAGGAITDLEADLVISRALYDFYILGKELTKEQEDLFDRYSLFVARRPTDVADLKTQLLNKRKAAAATAPPRSTPLAPPTNDTCAGAEVIAGTGPFPIFTAVTADITDATVTGDPPVPSCQTSVSRSIWYRFTPAASGVYAISTCGSDGTASTLDDAVMAIYTSSDGTCGGTFTEIPTAGLSAGCSDDDCVTEALQAVITTQLNAGTQYYIVVWQFEDTPPAPPTPGNTSVQLRISQVVPPVNDTCAGAVALALDTPVTGTTAFALNDYHLSGSACFTGLGQTASTADGNDVVYSFVAPAAGSYSFRTTNFDIVSNLVLYTASSCPAATPGSPVTVATCLAASNRVIGNTSEEVVCQPMTVGQQLFIFVDQGTATFDGSSFTIEVNLCTREVEPNGTPATANAFQCGIEGTISPGTEADFYTLGSLAAGSRVFAMVDAIPAKSNDFDMRITTATDTLEYDDWENAQPFGSNAPNVAGTPATGVATFIRINHFASLESEPYRLYAVVQPPGANPNCNCAATDEAEPNNTTATANTASNNFFYGTLSAPSPSTDVDVYSFTANAGDLIFLSLDGDPKRDNTTINGQLALLSSAGATLISVNDGGVMSSNTPGAGSLVATTPFSPGEALLWRATTTGTYYAQVSIGTSTLATGVGDYLLSISRNCFAGTPPTANVSGIISYCITPSRQVPGVLVTASPSLQTSTSDIAGSYNLTGLTQGGNYTVTPSKTGDVNGITSFDASLVARAAASLITLTSCQQIAGDASNNGSIASFDASLIARTAASIPNTGIAGTWKFVPSSRFNPNLSGNQTGQNYDAILVGDVSGNWTPPGSGPTARQTQAPTVSTVSVSLPNSAAPSGASLSIAVTVGQLPAAADLNAVFSFDLRLVFNPAVLQLQGTPVTTAGTLTNGITPTVNADNVNGVLIANVFSAAPITGSGVLLRVNFTAVGAQGLSSPLTWQANAGGFPPNGFIFNEGDPGASPITNGSVTVLSPTAVKLNSLAASGYEKGVFLQWQTGYEANNLGFNVYRSTGGDFTRITPEILAGSALVTGAVPLTAGRSYGWWDPHAQDNQDALYYIEDIDLNGYRTLHGPVAVVRTGGSPPEHSQAALLSQLGKGSRLVGPPPLALGASKSSFVRTSQNDFPLASGAAVKIAVREDGWYRIGRSELLAAGLSPDVNPRFLQLYVDGRELPFIVTGEADGRFDSNDAVEFFGTAMDSAATDQHVYWLVAGSRAGERVQSTPVHKGSPSPASFQFTVQRKDRTVYFSGLRNGDRENFFGAVIAGNSVDQELTVQHLDEASREPASLDVSLQGVTLAGHQVRVIFNGTDVGSVSFVGQAAGMAHISISSSLLKEGANRVTLSAQGGQIDVSLVDNIQLSYQRTFTADNNTLRVTASSNQVVTIGGFTNDKIQVMDITNSGAVQELTGNVQQDKFGYSVTVTTPWGSDERILFAFASEQVSRPAAVWANRPSKLRQRGQGADLLIVTRPDFIDGLELLKAVRLRQGLSVSMVDAEDIYDEFNYGHKSPLALKDFLLFARVNWKKAPRFLLLAGDASYDPKNYLGRGDFDFVPTKLIDTQFMETASDDWLGDSDGDGLSEMAIGRLPMRTAEDALQMALKIISYDQSARTEGVVLVADSSDGYDFAAMNSQLKSLIPPDTRVTEIDRGKLEPATAKSELLAAINAGKKVVNYAGHGSVDMWRGNLLTASDVSSMNNGANTTLFVMMTCLNGYFVDPQLDSLAEALMKWNNGAAVAVWASSGMTMPDDQGVMDVEAFARLFDPNNSLTLGEITSRAKARVLNTDVRLTWVLFGDPTTRLK
jgi:hypothetical protein